MPTLKSLVRDVPDFPKKGIVFRDITPLLTHHFAETAAAMDGIFTAKEWKSAHAVACIESRGFILGAALAAKRGIGFVPIRKKGKLPPPVVDVEYSLEYGSGVLEMQKGAGRVLLVDDVLATGGTLAASAELCLKAGYEPLAFGVLIDLRFLNAFEWRGMKARSVMQYE